MKKWGDRWPFLSHDPNVSPTAVEYEWELYFRDHLRGFPPSYRLFRDGRIRYWNAPEAVPQDFDSTYMKPVEIHASRAHRAERTDEPIARDVARELEAGGIREGESAVLRAALRAIARED